MPPPRRNCARCGNQLSLKRQRKKYCYLCSVRVQREAADKKHRARIAKTYGLLPGDYEAIYSHQGGRCAICQRATGASKRLAVDHDHKIGWVREAVRGLCCAECNGMLGHARDDPAVFTRAAEYLRNPPARKVLT